MLGLMIVQVSLGISTLLLHMPVPLAAAHQVGAIALLSASLYVTHSLHCSTSLPMQRDGAALGSMPSAQ
jgi:cytochrome c oxidase assembly protein subunit 15